MIKDLGRGSWSGERGGGGMRRVTEREKERERERKKERKGKRGRSASVILLCAD